MKILRYFLFGLLVLSVILSHLSTSTDLNQDLSRHLKIGEIIATTHTIPATNYFSYTYPDFPFINHHWLAEIVFYWLAQSFGLNSLIYLKTFLIVAAVMIVVFTPLTKTSAINRCLAAFILMPLLLERSYIRPEMFAYVFFAFTLFVVLTYPKYPKLLYFLPLIMLLWVNTHITFVFGMFLLALHTWRTVFKRKVLRSTFYVLSLTWLAFLLNPHFITGALYPFFVLHNYGYTIVENQNLFFLSHATFNPFIRYFFLISPLTLLAFIVLLLHKRWLHAFVLTVFFGLTLYQIRHLPFFVLAAIPIWAEAAGCMSMRLQSRYYQYARWIILIVGILWAGWWIYLIGTNTLYRRFDLDNQTGVGFKESGQQATQYILDHHLTGNIFNNFDNGGEMIYRLYPQYRVFVDNRPEAYPKEFLQDVYIKLQEDPAFQKSVFDKYQISTVIFAHTDQTPWANAFITAILQDPYWSLNYVDTTTMILTRGQELPDIRSDEVYLRRYIDQATNYIDLLHYIHLLSILKQDTLVSLALAKANQLNPNSCALKKQEYYSLQDTPWFDQAERIKSEYWYCF